MLKTEEEDRIEDGDIPVQSKLMEMVQREWEDEKYRREEND